MARERKLPAWQQPAWTPQLERWTAKQIRLNQWKFDAADDFEDIMQEAKLLFFTLSKTYPIASKDAHLATIYRTSFSRKLIDRARQRKYRITVDETPVEEMADSLHGLPNYGPLSMLLEEMPDELKLVLGALTTGRVRLSLNKPTKASRPRENHNMRLRRRFALPDTANPVGNLKAYFSNS